MALDSRFLRLAFVHSLYLFGWSLCILEKILISKFQFFGDDSSLSLPLELNRMRKAGFGVCTAHQQFLDVDSNGELFLRFLIGVS